MFFSFSLILEQFCLITSIFDKFGQKSIKFSIPLLKTWQLIFNISTVDWQHKLKAIHAITCNLVPSGALWFWYQRSDLFITVHNGANWKTFVQCIFMQQIYYSITSYPNFSAIGYVTWWYTDIHAVSMVERNTTKSLTNILLPYGFLRAKLH